MGVNVAAGRAVADGHGSFIPGLHVHWDSGADGRICNLVVQYWSRQEPWSNLGRRERWRQWWQLGLSVVVVGGMEGRVEELGAVWKRMVVRKEGVWCGWSWTIVGVGSGRVRVVAVADGVRAAVVDAHVHGGDLHVVAIGREASTPGAPPLAVVVGVVVAAGINLRLDGDHCVG